jgi:photosystem II stability/assembly factor-like uncharacterized protein
VKGIARFLLALALLVAGIAPASAGSNAWTTNGPSVNGILWRLALDPTRTATIYAAGSSGSGATVSPRVFRSIDVGATWQELTNGIVNVQVNVLTVDPTNGTTLYVGGYNPAAQSLALYKSTNSGSSWMLLAWPFSGTDLDRPVLAMAIDPTNARNLYVGTSTGVLKSTDGGGSWVALSGLPAAGYRSIVVDRTNGNNVYVAGDAGVYKTISGGAAWSAANNGLPSAPGGTLPRGNQLVFDPASPAVLFAVVSGTSGDLVFRTADSAGSWTNSSNGLPSDVIRDLAVDPRNSRSLYAALNGGSGQNLMRSTDGGASWTQFSLPGGGYSSAVVLDTPDPQTIHVAHNDAVWDLTFGTGGAAPPAATVTPALSVTPAPAGTATPVGTATAAPRDNRYFSQTGFRVDNDAFWDYFNRRGGARMFGLPTSRTFSFLGFTSQFFQRAVMQLGPDGSVRLINLLDPGLLPFTSFNGAVVPGPDAALSSGAPAPGSPNYGSAVIAFVRANAPNSFDGKATNFSATFDNTVTLATAYPQGGGNPELLPGINLELWGVPTSRPAYDPTNRNFIYQRFQRGIMHFDQGCMCTQGLLLADYLKAIITGRNLPTDVANQASASPFMKQYNSGKPGWVDRPEVLPGTDLTNAFETQ